MEFFIEEETFKGRNLKVVLSGLFGTASLWIDGAKVNTEKKMFGPKSRQTGVLQDNSGNVVLAVIIKPTFDPVPQLILNGKTIILAPPLKWFEYAWIAGPLLILMLAGGALPVIFAGVGFFINTKIFRAKSLNGFFRYFFTLLSSAIIWLACLLTVGTIAIALKKN